MGNNEVIRFNRKNNYFSQFSNFYPCEIAIDGITYKSVEAAWQAQKTLDIEERKMFSKLLPSEAKSRGRKVNLRPDWEYVKDDLMYKICLVKFSQNEELKQLILSTGDAELIEDTTGWHDNIWGWCSCERCKNRVHQNRLGKCLMKVRETIEITELRR